MTEIGLLMKGVLNARLSTLSHLAVQENFQPKNGLHKSTNRQSTRLVPTTQITPPEFIQTEGNTHAKSAILALRRNNLLQQIKQKYPNSGLLNLASAQDIPISRQKTVKLSPRYPGFTKQPPPILRFGSSGISVRILQRLLMSKGYGVGVDGNFGPLTETAVKAFQHQRRLLVDGIVGQRTWWELTI
ncbi:peptidoglycan-binding domain-containing protein [Cronbergia sp. UHCC 0137]|uniref:peptidoglycan-binding domain-containing protein n=1 Tax=Cronbergia sp. UHCC 0137 TaxID=3110239 RepID=UPI002B204FF4|nr:peptidoglycan-binding domain-containing protein [Cronbergia sp. UHCC 0137]MEA5619361.1 peptidoglycan-binding domain-containing protein [Cronbergia sp. UHCC 0137]